MLSASMGALESSARLRNVEKTAASVNAAARLIQSSLRAAPDMAFAADCGQWFSDSGDGIVQGVLVSALNGGGDFVWSVESERPDAKDAFTDLRLSVTAENRTAESLEECLASGGPERMPTIVIRFTHPADGAAPDYAMTMRITAQDVTADGEAGYVVKFADADGNLKVTASLGAP